MSISKIIHDVNPRFSNFVKKDTTKMLERLPGEYKIFTYPNGKQTVIDAKGNVVLTQITENGKTYVA